MTSAPSIFWIGVILLLKFNLNQSEKKFHWGGGMQSRLDLTPFDMYLMQNLTE